MNPILKDYVYGNNAIAIGILLEQKMVLVSFEKSTNRQDKLDVASKTTSAIEEKQKSLVKRK